MTPLERALHDCERALDYARHVQEEDRQRQEAYAATLRRLQAKLGPMSPLMEETHD